MSIQNEAKTYLARYFTGEAASSQSDEAVRVLQIGAKAKELLCVILSRSEESRLPETRVQKAGKERIASRRSFDSSSFRSR